MTKETLLKFKKIYEENGNLKELAKVERNLKAYGVVEEPKKEASKKKE